MSLLIISYNHISSVTVSSSNRHAVCADCLLSRHALHGYLDSWRWDPLFIPKHCNGNTISWCVLSQKRAGPKHV